MDDPGNDLWGLDSCRPKCGNGIHEDSYPAQDGGTFYEECDLGYTLNTDDGDVYENPCSSTCKKRGTTIGQDIHLWKCEASGTDRDRVTTCHFLCGNKYLDVDEYEPCDRLSQPYSAKTKDGFVDYVANFDHDPLTNSDLNIGCT